MRLCVQKNLLHLPLAAPVAAVVQINADFVLWTADPLTTIGGQAYMTVIDGRIVYQAE